MLSILLLAMLASARTPTTVWVQTGTNGADVRTFPANPVPKPAGGTPVAVGPEDRDVQTRPTLPPAVVGTDLAAVNCTAVLLINPDGAVSTATFDPEACPTLFRDLIATSLTGWRETPLARTAVQVERTDRVNWTFTVADTPSTGKVTGGAPLVRGMIDRVAVVAVVRENIVSVGRCYGAVLREHPSTHGAMNVAFDVGPDGKPAGVTVTGNQTTSTDLADCVQRVVGMWTFPTPDSGGTAHIVFPFGFEPS